MIRRLLQEYISGGSKKENEEKYMREQGEVPDYRGVDEK